jgi:tetratricopeptide (TPR) repeat protein
MLQLYPQGIHSAVDPLPSRPIVRSGGVVLFVEPMRKLTIVLGLATMALAAGAHAEDKKQAPEAAAKSEGGVRRDPKGIKGISPYAELIAKGDRAYVARDFDGAIAAYREAIQKEPQNALAHYRVGSAQLAKGDQKEAEAAWVAGMRFVGKDGTLKAKLIFQLADLRERQKNNDEAIGRWKEYSANSEAEKEAITYPASATERVSRNEAWKKNAADSAEVKTRIQKRLKEADEASRKSAADPKNK